ncbi:MAG: hypothetical protein IIB72_00270, partial [Proteobacteria bacterium]|nr:hypothetical protein [Pseudomonadota bacterium]
MSNGFAQDIVVDPDIARVPIAEFVEYYEDASETLSIDEVLAPSFGVNFIAHSRDILHFGITSSAYWIRFSLDWSDSDDQSQVLEFGPPKLVAGIVRGGIELFVVDDDGNLVSQYTMGTQTSTREIKTLNRGFALLIDPSYGSHFLLRITSARPLRLPITLWKVEDFRAAAQNADTLLGIQYGILLAMLFFNLFLFFSIKEPSYLFYVAAIATQTLFIFLDSKHLRFILDELYRGSYWTDMSER